MLASRDTHSDRSTNSSSSGSIGVSVGANTGITANASRGKGHGNSDDVVYNNTHVNAANTVTIQSGGDTNLKGAVVSGKQVIADVGGDLNMESLQDTSKFDGKQQSIGGSITVGAGVSGSLSYSNSKANGDYASVREQTGIQAGDGGFQANVKGNTDLKGAVLASNQTAIDNHRNSLSTGTLTHSDIENHSNYSASGINLSGGISVAGDKPAGKSSGTSTTTGSSTVDNGTDWSWQNFGKPGVNGAAAGVSSESGNENSVTRSGVSSGSLTITSEAGQQQKTGQSAADVVASVKRDVTSGPDAGALAKNWEGQKLLQEQAANAQIVATFGQQASKAVGDYAQTQTEEARRLREQARAESDPQRRSELETQANKLEDAWGDNGSLRLAAHTVIGGLTGGVGGAAGAAVGTLTAPAVAQALNEAGITGPLADVLTAAASTAAGAAAGGVSGAAAAGNEVANNYLKHADVLALEKKLKACPDQACKDDAIKEAYLTSAKNDLELLNCKATNNCNSLEAEYRKGYTEIANLLDRGVSANDVENILKLESNAQAAIRNQLPERQCSTAACQANAQYLVGLATGLSNITPAGAVVGLGHAAYQLVASLANRGLEGTALVIVKGMAGLPENIVSGLYSEDPKVRGETLVNALLIGGVATTLGAKLGIKVLDNAGAGPSHGSLEAQRGGVKVSTDDRSFGAKDAAAVEPVVIARGTVKGTIFEDVNQTAKVGVADGPTLIADRITTKIETQGKKFPNRTIADSHAEIGVIQQAYSAGKTKGAEMTMTVSGKDVCGYCIGDIAAAAEIAGLKTLTVQAVDNVTGLPKTYYWQPGMKSIKEKP